MWKKLSLHLKMADQAQDIVVEFYKAFQKADSKSMNLLYHNDLRFHDPVFGELDYQETTAMWQMLCSANQTLTIDFSINDATKNEVRVRWEARYHFGKKKRPVHNIISTHMVVEEQRIKYHTDSFNLYRWTRQAIGWPGAMFGWAPFFKRKIRKMSRNYLQSYMNKQA